MVVATAVLYLPFVAFLFSLPHAANQMAPLVVLYPWLLIVGAWSAVWLALRAELWLVTCSLLAILLGVLVYAMGVSAI
jgi:hypothetical protein